MRKPIVTIADLGTDNRLNPLKHVDLASRPYLMQLLAWMWLLIFSLSFLSTYVFGYVWTSSILLIAGIFITITLFRRAETRQQKMSPAPYLSRASKCVWQMDREA